MVPVDDMYKGQPCYESMGQDIKHGNNVGIFLVVIYVCILSLAEN